MRRTFLATLLTLILGAFAGCASNFCGDDCHGCHLGTNACADRPCNDGHQCCLHGCCQGGHGPGCGVGQTGPGGNGYVSYPYYTIRGPRDFLETNPQSIGP